QQQYSVEINLSFDWTNWHEFWRQAQFKKLSLGAVQMPKSQRFNEHSTSLLMGVLVLLLLFGLIGDLSGQDRDLGERLGMAQLQETPPATKDGWNTVFRHGMDLRRNGKYSDAVSAFTQSLIIARLSNDPRRIANSLNMLGLVYWFEGRLREAERTLREDI